MRRLSQAGRIGLLIEVVICFGPIALLLCVGYIFALPSFLLASHPPQSADELAPLAWILGGTFGLSALAIVVGALCSDTDTVRRPEIALVGMIAGCAAIVHYIGISGPFNPLMIIGLLPVLASVHIAYLARALLFRPGVMTRTLIAVVAICIVVGAVVAVINAT